MATLASPHLLLDTIDEICCRVEGNGDGIVLGLCFQLEVEAWLEGDVDGDTVDNEDFSLTPKGSMVPNTARLTPFQRPPQKLLRVCSPPSFIIPRSSTGL